MKHKVYNVIVSQNCSIDCEVEADSEEEAREMIERELRETGYYADDVPFEASHGAKITDIELDYEWEDED